MKPRYSPTTVPSVSSSWGRNGHAARARHGRTVQGRWSGAKPWDGRSGNRGELVFSPWRVWLRGTRTKPRSGDRSAVAGSAKANTVRPATEGGIGERINQTKGGDAGGLSALIVPLKAGNRVHRDPREGAGIMPTDPLVGNEERNPECYRHGHETTGDRRTGEAAPGPGVPVPAPSDRHRMEARGVPPDAEGRCGGMDGVTEADDEKERESHRSDLRNRI